LSTVAVTFGKENGPADLRRTRRQIQFMLGNGFDTDRKNDDPARCEDASRIFDLIKVSRQAPIVPDCAATYLLLHTTHDEITPRTVKSAVTCRARRAGPPHISEKLILWLLRSTESGLYIFTAGQGHELLLPTPRPRRAPQARQRWG
jgi:hypothetical protein